MKKASSWSFYSSSIKKFDDRVSFEKSAWWGHHFFAYDLVCNTKPGRIVELGTYWGFSFFTFCQAVKDQKLNTDLYAIDSWEGDKQTGFYGKEVLEYIKNTTKKDFPKQNIHLLKGLFEKQLPKFKDGSIDILHIDGLHTYKAVKKDFQSWIPKMKKDGIILLHDVCVVKDDFGVHKLWEEIKKEFQTIEFYHSHGLGVVFLGKNIFESNAGEIKYYYQRLYEDELVGKSIKLEEKIRENQKLDKSLSKILSENNKLQNVCKENAKTIDLLNLELDTIKHSRVWKARNKAAKLIGKKEIR